MARERPEAVHEDASSKRQRGSTALSGSPPKGSKRLLSTDLGAVGSLYKVKVV